MNPPSNTNNLAETPTPEADLDHGINTVDALSHTLKHLGSSLEEVTRFNLLITTAKTQAKKDFYKRKLQKIVKKLRRSFQ